MTIGAIREIARAEMSGRRLILMVGFVLTLVSWTIVGQIYMTLFGFQRVFSIFNPIFDGWTGFEGQYLLFPLFILLLYFVGDTLHISYRWFVLDFLDNKEAGIRDIFQGLKKEKIQSVLSLVALRGILLLGWSLLFILPGIWKAYLYSQAPNFLKDQPDLSAKEALEKSEEQMRGFSVDYFMLQLSFIPWYIVPIALLIYGVWANRSEIALAFEMGAETTNLILGFLAMTLLIVGVLLLLFALYVEPYKMVSKQIFYREITSKEQEELNEHSTEYL